MEMAKATRAHVRASTKYNTKTYDNIHFVSRKEERLPDLISLAASRSGESKGAYITRAIKFQLQQDGITLDMLYPLETQETADSPEWTLRHYIGYEVLYYYNDPKETDEWYQHYMETQYLTTILEEAREKARKFYSKQPEFKKQFTKYYIRGWNIEAHNRAEAEQILKKMFEDSNDPDLEYELPDAVYNEEVEL